MMKTAQMLILCRGQIKGQAKKSGMTLRSSTLYNFWSLSGVSQHQRNKYSLDSDLSLKNLKA